jgi:hypothetical protein
MMVLKKKREHFGLAGQIKKPRLRGADLQLNAG